MTTWKDLENKFCELEPALKYARVDGQWGSAGEFWRIAGTYDNYTAQRFEAYAKIAGEKLKECVTGTPHPAAEIIIDPDPVRRWYKAIAKLTNNMKYHGPGQEMDENGNVLGYIYAGYIDRIAEASSILCIELQVQLPEGNENKARNISKWKIFWDKYTVPIIVSVIGAVIAGIILTAIL